MSTTATSSLSQTTYKLTPITAVLGVQMLFVAFGALVLVPLLTGLDTNVALFTAGVGTLLFQLVTRGQVPVFLASSFAFIAPIIYGTQTWGLPATLCGLAAAGVVYAVLSVVVRLGGVELLHGLLPPVVIGPVIMVIGIILAPVAIAPAIEHFGDILTIGSVTGRDYVAKPGLHRTLLGDGIATFVASVMGGPPNTTYSEVTGAVTLTRAFNPAVMTCAAVAAIVLAFVGKVGGLLQTIPTPVMGGLLVILFGAIVVIGLNLLVKAGEDLLEPRNLTIVALVLVTGVGGLSVGTADWALKGIGLAGIIGVVANLVLPGRAARS